jgi:hypothetical protein
MKEMLEYVMLAGHVAYDIIALAEKEPSKEELDAQVHKD